jgi:hypothetical protein
MHRWYMFNKVSTLSSLEIIKNLHLFTESRLWFLVYLINKFGSAHTRLVKLKYRYLFKEYQMIGWICNCNFDWSINHCYFSLHYIFLMFCTFIIFKSLNIIAIGCYFHSITNHFYWWSYIYVFENQNKIS